ncbi:MAG: hypothetical protein Q7U39_09020 [Nitrospira sp.]|nr:hypothetical protein [Nitrospira sp.]
MAIPAFEKVAVVGDNARLVAEISSLFTRPHYLPIISGPHLARPDWSNEVIRRTNAISTAESRRVLLADTTVDQNRSMSEGKPAGMFIHVRSRDEAQEALKGWTKGPKKRLVWGSDNLGIGVLLARRSKKLLDTTTAESHTTDFVASGTHLLIICERGNPLAEVIASNMAFATDASFLTHPKLPDSEQTEWLEEIYALGSGGNASHRFATIRDRVRGQLPNIDFSQYKQLLFITNRFPWGIAVPERPTTHMFAFPDFGLSMVEGLWAASQAEHSARTALLIQPGEVSGSEIDVIAESLGQNKTLVRVQLGPAATVLNVMMLMETVPFDIIVISTHAGDVPGQRVTYDFKDSEGIARRLVIDEGVGFAYDHKSEKVLVQTFSRFHELDGVDWTDSAAKSNLYVGTSITTWAGMDIFEKKKYRVASEEISRVIGSMGLQMHDHMWIPALHGFAPDCTPVIFNNACSSWHRLSASFMFAGARAYVGTLFPVIEPEAQEIGRSFFREGLGLSLPEALWASQNRVYQSQDRRPYAMVGLPFCSIRVNTVNSVKYLSSYYPRAISDCSRHAEMTPYRELRENYLRHRDFLTKEAETLSKSLRPLIDSSI